jgi:hypothetical protein
VRSGVDSATSVELTYRRFEEFYAADRERIYRALAVTLRNPDLAAEATDEAMTRAYQRWGLVRAYDNPTGWVYRVALNWARSRLRRHSREHAGDGRESAYEPCFPSPRCIGPLPRSLTITVRWWYSDIYSIGRRGTSPQPLECQQEP